MIAPFSRRDTVKYALSTAAMIGPMPLLALASRNGWEWRGAAWAVAAAAMGMLVPLAMGRGLPPDLPLLPLSTDAARRALAPAPPGIARLRVAVAHEPLGAYRIDLYLDGLRIGQARSGAAVVIPLQFGQHALTMRVWLRELETTALINALPGTDTDLVVRVSGGKSRRYSVTRQDLAVALADRRIVLSGPPEPTGS